MTAPARRRRPDDAAAAAAASSSSVDGRRSRLLGFVWLAVAAAVGLVLAVLYPDSSQQDGGNHFLIARWAWKHPALFVDVWGRPLFTFLYALPAQLGYLPAKLATVAVTVAAAWQTWRLAEDEGFERAWLVVPLTFLQPAVLALYTETMTEPLLALVFIVALRLHRRGRVRAGMAVASLMPLARPEGFFLCLLWGVWVLLDRRDGRAPWRRALSTPWLAAGSVAWWLAALAITGDPLYIVHHWPPNWGPASANYGTGPWLAYWYQRSIIAGRLLYVPFLVGLAVLVARRRLGTVTSAFLLLFVLHSVFWRYGLFSAAGYPRYFVCVAPATALITLAGWNAVARLLAERRVPPPVLRAASAVVLAVSALSALGYVDSLPWARDAWGIASTYERGASSVRQRPVRQFVWSQTYMCILVDCDPDATLRMTDDRARNLELLRAAPAGTLVFWESETGPQWYKLQEPDIAAVGYEVLRSDHYSLVGRVPLPFWRPVAGPRAQTISLLYKRAAPPESSTTSLGGASRRE
ncbi:MAG TPA: hypothetical protein VFJ74_00780 [Gemmatimonadaceae bacterium]|nr:hypothetical protein [Gemmatimonadaceae bacterium]